MYQKRMIGCMIVSVLALICLLGSYPISSAKKHETPVLAEMEADADPITRILVLGADRSVGLTDSMFILTLNELTKEVSILQIPRDTYAEYTDRDYKKINGAANAMGNAALTAFLSDAMQVKLHAYIKLDLDVLAQLIDDIGGVDVEVPQEMNYSDPAQGLEIQLPQGKVHLDGKTAEHFVRYRAGYADADLGRLDAQKLFLRAVAQKCKSLRLSQVLKAAFSALPHVNTNISLPDAIRVLTVLMDCDADAFPMATLAGQAVKGNSGAWYYSLNRQGTVRMINEYLLPKTQISCDQFDPGGVFDREGPRDFHAIYEAMETELPLPIV